MNIGFVRARRVVCAAVAGLLWVMPAHAADPLDHAAQMRITLLAEDVAHERPGKARRELEGDLLAAYYEYALARVRLHADHATTVRRLDRLADDPDLALPVLAARAARYAPGSPTRARWRATTWGCAPFWATTLPPGRVCLPPLTAPGAAAGKAPRKRLCRAGLRHQPVVFRERTLPSPGARTVHRPRDTSAPGRRRWTGDDRRP